MAGRPSAGEKRDHLPTPLADRLRGGSRDPHAATHTPTARRDPRDRNTPCPPHSDRTSSTRRSSRRRSPWHRGMNIFGGSRAVVINPTLQNGRARVGANITVPFDSIGKAQVIPEGGALTPKRLTQSSESGEVIHPRRRRVDQRPRGDGDGAVTSTRSRARYPRGPHVQDGRRDRPAPRDAWSRPRWSTTADGGERLVGRDQRHDAEVRRRAREARARDLVRQEQRDCGTSRAFRLDGPPALHAGRGHAPGVDQQHPARDERQERPRARHEPRFLLDSMLVGEGAVAAWWTRTSPSGRTATRSPTTPCSSTTRTW